MRALIYQALSEAQEIIDEVGDRIYQSSALGTSDIPADPEPPYIMYSFLPANRYREVRETSKAKAHVCQVWVYDERGSFIRIERILGIVDQTVEALAGAISPSGAICLEVEARGWSGDLPPTTSGKNQKFTTFRITASQ